MGALAPWHWAIIILALIILFGSKRLPDAARGIGKSLRIFKAETKGLRDDHDAAPGAQPQSAQPVQPVQPAQLLPPATPEAGQPQQPSGRSDTRAS